MSNTNDTFISEVEEELKEMFGADRVSANVVIPIRGDGGEDVSEEDDFGADNALAEKMFKLRKKLRPDMVEDLEALDTEQLRGRIVQSEINLHDTDQAMKADRDLNTLKERLKEARAPYMDAKKEQTAIAQYCTCLLSQRGKA